MRIKKILIGLFSVAAAATLAGCGDEDVGDVSLGFLSLKDI